MMTSDPDIEPPVTQRKTMRKARQIAIWCLAALLLSSCGSQLALLIGRLREWKSEVAPFEALGGIVTAAGGGDMGIWAGRDGVAKIHLGDKAGDLELAGLAERMERFPNLHTLCLEGPNVTDVGLNHLKGLRQLHSLLLYDTRVTQEAAANLERELPRLTVGRIKLEH